jgi:hypothetical protein
MLLLLAWFLTERAAHDPQPSVRSLLVSYAASLRGCRLEQLQPPSPSPSTTQQQQGTSLGRGADGSPPAKRPRRAPVAAAGAAAAQGSGGSGGGGGGGSAAAAAAFGCGPAVAPDAVSRTRQELVRFLVRWSEA